MAERFCPVDSPEDIKQCLNCKRPTCNDCLSKGGRIKRRAKRRPVTQIDATTGEVIAEYPSINEAYRQTGVCMTQIRQCFLGKIKTAGGYVWRSEPPEGW